MIFPVGKKQENLWHRRCVCLALATKGQSYKVISVIGERKLPDWREKFKSIRRGTLVQ